METKTDKNHFCSVWIGEVEVAIDVNFAREVVNCPSNIIQVPFSQGFLKGFFNLRGNIVPIVDMGVLLNMESSKEAPQKILIVEHDGIYAGLAVGRIGELIQSDSVDTAKSERISKLQYSIVMSILKHKKDGRLLQLLNVRAIVDIEKSDEILAVQRQQNKKNSIELKRKNQKCISFSAGGLIWGFPLLGVHEVVGTSQIQDSVFKSKLCKGMLELRGNIIPVIDLGSFLTGKSIEKQFVGREKILILKNSNEMIGLLVDSIEKTVSFETNDVLQLEVFSANSSRLLLGCISLDNREVTLLNSDEILRRNELIEISQGHRHVYRAKEKGSVDTKKDDSNTSFISFRVGPLLCVPLSEVREVLDLSVEPSKTLGVPNYVTGIINVRGEIVTIVDSRYYFNLSSVPTYSNTLKYKVVVFQRDSESFGLLVDSVENIVNINQSNKIKLPGLYKNEFSDFFQSHLREMVMFSDRTKPPEESLIILDTSFLKKNIELTRAS